MANEIYTVYKELYAENFQLALQREDFMLANWVEQRTDYEGNRVQPLKTVGKVSFSTMTSLAATNWTQPAFYARSLTGTPVHLPLIYDWAQEVQLGFSPEGALVKAARAALNRKKDETILDACFANAQTGGDGGTTTAFPSSMVVDVNVGGTNSGLNYKKVTTALKLLGINEVNKNEPMCMVVSSAQMDELMNQSEAIMTDYNVKARRDENGRVIGLLGVDIVEINHANFLSGGIRSVPLFVKSGMHLGIWRTGVIVRMDELPEHSYAKGVYHAFMLGATRTDEGKVVKIQCAEA